MPDPKLRQFATDKEWEALSLFEEMGSSIKAGERLGVTPNAVRNYKTRILRRAALAGYAPDEDLNHPLPPGQTLKGVSTYYGQDGGVRGQWVKTTADREAEFEALREALEGFREDLPKAQPVEPPSSTLDDLAACYLIGDHHLGMLAWGDETEHSYDMELGERLLSGAMSYLVGSMPQARQGVIVVLGDFLHYDSLQPETPTAKNALDTDTRFGKLVRTSIRVLRGMIDRALSRHSEVLVIVETGNHDLASSIWLRETFASFYESEPRITVDDSPRHFHYWRFGRVLVGVHHGHGPKPQELPLIMAHDRPEDWGQSDHRYIWTGHIHRDSTLDIRGVRVESFRVLPPPDAWAYNLGYRSAREMKAILLHRDFGEVGRYTVNVGMLGEGKPIGPKEKKDD